MSFLRRNCVSLWQVAYLLFATSWLFAPYLNGNLSDRATSISQFMIPGMPYAWFFRICEFIAAALLLIVVVGLYARSQKLTLPILLLSIIGIGALIDLIVPTTCFISNGVCQEIAGAEAVVHMLETIVVSVALLALTAWDAWRNKRTPSQVFFILQILVGIVLLASWVHELELDTLLQFFYQAGVVVWITWFVSGELEGEQKTYRLRRSRVNQLLAIFVGLQGIVTILIGTTNFEFSLGNTYFNSQAILFAHHSLVIGVAFLYLSRHIARGERRAWQVLMLLIGLEALKYSVLLPQPFFLTLYLAGFVLIFIAKDFFNRGMQATTWRSKAYDVGIIICAVILAASLASVIRAITHGTGSADFSRAAVTLILSAGVFILWTLFRPASRTRLQPSAQEIEEAQLLLRLGSNSTEDFFKLWPLDKEYFWSKRRDGFVAYKLVGPVAFALADPIAKSDYLRKKVLDEFVTHCQLHGWRACFLLVSEKSLPLYNKVGLKSLKIGASAVIDIEKYVSETARNKWWRWQRNKGRKMNYTYELMSPPHANSLMQNLRDVSDEWLQRGGHQEEGFALGYFNTEYLQRCRVHVLKNEIGRIVAFVNELPVFHDGNMTTIDLIRFVNDAPNANNYLLYCLLHGLEEEKKYQFFDMGFVPLARMRGKLTNTVRKLGANRFSAAGLEQFKNKFEPEWKSNYIAYDGDPGDLALIALRLEDSMAVDSRDLGK